jgi:lipid A 4'-phosphatase
MTLNNADAGPRAVAFRNRFLTGTLATAVCLVLVFAAFPGLDLGVSHLIRSACADASGMEGWCSKAVLQPARSGFIFFSVCVGAMVLTGIVRGRLADKPALGLDRIGRVGWVFVAAHFAVSVGLVANVVLKDHWGRARPHQTAAFGGTKQFTAALSPADQCIRNCSFVSGEATAVYAPFFAAALLVPQYGVPLAAAGIATGLASGGVRMLAGAHFLSDVLFAGVFSALTAIGLHALFFGRSATFRNRYGRSAVTGYPLELTDWWPATENVFRSAGLLGSRDTAEPSA